MRSTEMIYIMELLSRIDDENLRSRIEHELLTYAKRARINKALYYLLTLSTIVFPIGIAFINTFDTSPISSFKILVAVLSGLSALSATILVTVHIQEHWMNYRYNCELLKAEVFMYVEKTAPYNDTDDKKNKDAFINNTIRLGIAEVESWQKILKKKD